MKCEICNKDAGGTKRFCGDPAITGTCANKRRVQRNQERYMAQKHGIVKRKVKCPVCEMMIHTFDQNRKYHGSQNEPDTCAWVANREQNLKRMNRTTTTERRKKEQRLRSQGYEVGMDDSWLNG